MSLKLSCRLTLALLWAALCAVADAGPDRSGSIVAVRVREGSTCAIDIRGQRTCRPGKLMSTGSAIVVDYTQRKSNTTGIADGYCLLTAAHVVRGGCVFEVKIGGEWVQAGLHGTLPGDDECDLALLTVQTNAEIVPVSLADTDPDGPEPIETLGHDLGEGNVVRPDEGQILGAITDTRANDGMGRVIRIRSVRKIRTRYSTTVGRSGGAVIDCESRLVGVISCHETTDTRDALCTPVSVVREFMRTRWRIPPAPREREPPPAPQPRLAPVPEPQPVSGIRCRCEDRLASLKAEIDSRVLAAELRPGTPGPAGPVGQAGPMGPRGTDAVVKSADISAAVASYIQANPSTVTVVIVDNGQQVFSKSGVPAGSVVRVPIQRTETSSGR